MNAILTCRTLLRRISVVHQITINIMLQDEPGGIEPVIKDLTTHDVSPNAPAILPTFMPQPVMTQHLRVKIVRFEARVMDMTLGAFEEEKAMVVDKLLPTVKSAECVEVAAGGIVDQLRWEEVEMSCVKLERLREIGDTDTEVAKFVNGCWGFFEALEGVRWTGLLFRLCVCQQLCMNLSKRRTALT